MEYRTEHDTMGEIKVPADRYWGAQTQRSLENFPVGSEKMPPEIIKAFGYLKCACAEANRHLKSDKMPDGKANAIIAAATEVFEGRLDGHFPLAVWQTGSGTQTNMNANEVIANRGSEISGKIKLHPNDDVNMSQSSNDTFPSAMHIAAVCSVTEKLLPSLERLIKEFARLEEENADIIKCGRTHLQDATPITFGEEISGWKAMLERCREQILLSLKGISKLAIGATAVGTGLNAPKGFDSYVCLELTRLTGHDFYPDDNKYHSLTSKDDIVFAHGALKALACDLMKIANDIRWLSSGPRTGLGEIFIPENEPGSSIMPGKVNPTQCESVTMVAVQVMANDTAVGIAASQGNFELNVFMPVIIYNYLQSVNLVADSMDSFRERCVSGITPNTDKMSENLNRSLMTVTALTPFIGYENAAKAAKKAHKENITLKESIISLGLMTAEEFDEKWKPEKMI